LKIRGILILVIAYILAAFGWWLYSLISYTNKDFQLKKDAIQFENEFLKQQAGYFFITHKNIVDTTPKVIYLKNKVVIDNYLNLILSKCKYNKKYAINNAEIDFFKCVEFKLEKNYLKKISDEHERKLRAYYSEGFVFGLAVILGVLWVFSRLESLLNLNKMQNNFLLSVTHELKTPLAAIKLSAQTINSRKLNEEQLAMVLNQTISNANRLNELIDNVLLTTRIDGSSYNYQMENINITQLITNEANAIFITPPFEGKIEITKEDYEVMGDILSLRLVFSNILQNALKYAGNNALINCNISKIDNQVKIKIADNGPGILPKERKKIFKKFYRIGDENTRNAKGTGLGLFIVKQILKQHKVKIKVEKNEPKGIIFTLIFNQK